MHRLLRPACILVLLSVAACSKKEFDDAVRDATNVDFLTKRDEKKTAPPAPPDAEPARAPKDVVPPPAPEREPEPEPARGTEDDASRAAPAATPEPPERDTTRDTKGPPPTVAPVAAATDPAVAAEPVAEEPAPARPPAEPTPAPVAEAEAPGATPAPDLPREGESVDELIARLGRAARNPGGARAAVHMLVEKGASAVPALAAALSERGEAAWHAGEALELMGPEARNAAPALMKMLKSYPYRAAKTLEAIGSDAAIATPLLLGLLKESKDGMVRAAAASAAGAVSRGVPGVVPVLIAALADGDRLVRVSAARGLGYRAAEAAAATRALIAALEDTMDDAEAGSLMREAQGALLRIGPAAVPLLVKAVTSETDGRIRSAAARTLERLGERASAALPALRKARAHDDAWVRATAVEVIEEIQRARTIVISGRAPEALSPDDVAADVPVSLDTKATLDALPLDPTPTLTLDLDGVKMELVYVKPGTNMMGSERGEPNERPVHIVSLNSGFYMAKTEVTQEQFEAITGWNPSNHRGGAHPVEMVLWHEVVAFCRRLSELTGLSVRLPTEAEWEYACRAGAMSAYGYGDDENDLTQHAWTADNAGGVPSAVGRRKPNAWGLHDMHGNVRELCYDFKADDYYARSPREDPTGPARGHVRVVRGGSYADGAAACRSAARAGSDPALRDRRVGFRVVVPAKGLLPTTISVKDRIESLAQLLKKGPDAGTKIAAVRDLERAGTLGVPHLAGALRDRDETVRLAAAVALGRIGPGARDATRHLAKRLTDRNAEVRRAAAAALGGIGPDARDALPALEKARGDYDQAARREAAGAIAIIEERDVVIAFHGEPYGAMVAVEDPHGELCVGGANREPLRKTGRREAMCPSRYGFTGRRATFAIPAPVFVARVTRANCRGGVVTIGRVEMRWEGGGERSATAFTWPLYERGARGRVTWTLEDATADQLAAARRAEEREREKCAGVLARRDARILQREPSGE